MITVVVPGKLYVAGEYAVLEPGSGAVLVAVDRYLTVGLQRRDDAHLTVSSELLACTTTLRRRGAQVVAPDSASPVERRVLGPVLAAITVVEAFAAESGRSPAGCDLTIRSALNDPATGAKLGLGSSGAVIVGVVQALAHRCRLDLDAHQLLKLALLAVYSWDPNASGGDVAAAITGGWAHYAAPDRVWPAERIDAGSSNAQLVDTRWPGLAMAAIAAPRGLALAVGWTGQPASSTSLVGAVRDRAGELAREWTEFVGRSGACVARMIDALEAGDDVGVAAAFVQSGRLLREFAATSGVPIETERLRALRRIAASLGIAAKSSGAGGGDCGIALVDPDAVATLHERWDAAGITPLQLRPSESGCRAVDTTRIGA